MNRFTGITNIFFFTEYLVFLKEAYRTHRFSVIPAKYRLLFSVILVIPAKYRLLFSVILVIPVIPAKYRLLFSEIPDYRFTDCTALIWQKGSK